MDSGKTDPGTRVLLHIIHSGAIGGGPTQVKLLASGLQAHGWHNVVISSDDGPLLEDLRARGVETATVGLQSIGRCVVNLPALMRHVRAARPSIVQVHGQFAGFFGGLAARLAGAPRVVYTAHFPSFMTDFNLAKRLRNDLAERVSCWCADAVVCLSHADQEEYVRRGLAARAKLSVIRAAWPEGWLNADTTPVSKPSLGVSEAARVIGFVGRMSDQKGVQHLIAAMPAVRHAHPDARLVLVGDGPLRGELERQVSALGLRECVVFTGFRRDVPALMRLCEVVAIPSIFEPGGTVCGEAMALGLPVVVSAVGGLAEIVAHGETGYVVRPADPSAVATALIDVLNSPARAREMGRAGQRRSLSLFNPGAIAAQYASLYERLLASGT